MAVSFNAAYGYFIVELAESFGERIPPDTFDEFERQYLTSSSPRTNTNQRRNSLALVRNSEHRRKCD